MNQIEWRITEQNLSQELASQDDRWHISKTQKGSEEPQFFLTNYDLLLTPHGTGADYRECFESFIKNCDAFVEKVKAVRAEAKEHMAILLETAQSLEGK